MRWDNIRKDFLALSIEERIALIKYTREERRRRYVPPPKKTKEKAPISAEKKTRKKKQPKDDALLQLVMAELERRKPDAN